VSYGFFHLPKFLLLLLVFDYIYISQGGETFTVWWNT